MLGSLVLQGVVQPYMTPDLAAGVTDEYIERCGVVRGSDAWHRVQAAFELRWRRVAAEGAAGVEDSAEQLAVATGRRAAEGASGGVEAVASPGSAIPGSRAPAGEKVVAAGVASEATVVWASRVMVGTVAMLEPDRSSALMTTST
jgi:hypothetical protein